MINSTTKILIHFQVIKYKLKNIIIRLAEIHLISIIK